MSQDKPKFGDVMAEQARELMRDVNRRFLGVRNVETGVSASAFTIAPQRKWRTMTIPDCIRVVESFEFRGGVALWRPKLAAAPIAYDEALMVSFSILVPDSHDPNAREVNISATQTWSLTVINSGFIAFEDMVAAFVRGLLEHEMHESVFIGSRQPINPHRVPDP